MKKNIINFIVGVITLFVGNQLFLLSLDSPFRGMSIWRSASMMAISYILAHIFIIVGIIKIYTVFHAFWKWYRYIPNPFTLEERRAISAITFLRENSTSLSLKKRQQIVADMMSARGDKVTRFRYTYLYGYRKKPNKSWSSVTEKDELLHSIQKLPLLDQEIELSEHGEFTRSSWLATEKLYWKNRGFPVKKE